MTKTVYVGYGFKLPRIELNKFKKLASVIDYNRETSSWIIKDGSELESLAALNEFFTGIVVIKQCPECRMDFEIDEGWALYGSTDFESHIEKHERQKNEINRNFADLADMLEELEYQHDRSWRWRMCCYCHSQMHAIRDDKGELWFTFLGARMRCPNCGYTRTYSIFNGSNYENDPTIVEPYKQMEMVDELEEYIEMKKRETLMKRLFNGVMVTSEEVIGEPRALTVDTKTKSEEV